MEVEYRCYRSASSCRRRRRRTAYFVPKAVAVLALLREDRRISIWQIAVLCSEKLLALSTSMHLPVSVGLEKMPRGLYDLAVMQVSYYLPTSNRLSPPFHIKISQFGGSRAADCCRLHKRNHAIMMSPIMPARYVQPLMRLFRPSNNW